MQHGECVCGVRQWHRYGARCHAIKTGTAERTFRDLTPAEKARNEKCRDETYDLIARGLIERERCEECGRYAQPHHVDYSDPRAIRWLCSDHHYDMHRRNGWKSS